MSARLIADMERHADKLDKHVAGYTMAGEARLRAAADRAAGLLRAASIAITAYDEACADARNEQETH